MVYTVSDADIFNGLKDVVKTWIPEIPEVNIRSAYSNRISQPIETNYCIITILNSKRRSWGTKTRTSTDEAIIDHVPQTFDCTAQIDFYGLEARSYSNTLVTICRSSQSAIGLYDIDNKDYLRKICIYSSGDAVNLTDIDGENQYRLRYATTVLFGYYVEVDYSGQGFNTAILPPEGITVLK